MGSPYIYSSGHVVDFPSATLTLCTIWLYSLSTQIVKDFLSGTGVEQIPPISFQKVGDSTVNDGIMPSIK